MRKSSVFVLVTLLSCRGQPGDSETSHSDPVPPPSALALDTVKVSRAIADAISKALLDSETLGAPPASFRRLAEEEAIPTEIHDRSACEQRGQMVTDGDALFASSRAGTTSTFEFTVAAQLAFDACAMPDANHEILVLTSDPHPTLEGTFWQRWAADATASTTTALVRMDIQLTGEVVATGTDDADVPCEMALSLTASGDGVLGSMVITRSVKGKLCGADVDEVSEYSY